jgi:hypothetical protein
MQLATLISVLASENRKSAEDACSQGLDDLISTHNASDFIRPT